MLDVWYPPRPPALSSKSIMSAGVCLWVCGCVCVNLGGWYSRDLALFKFYSSGENGHFNKLLKAKLQESTTALYWEIQPFLSKYRSNCETLPAMNWEFQQKNGIWTLSLMTAWLPDKLGVQPCEGKDFLSLSGVLELYRLNKHPASVSFFCFFLTTCECECECDSGFSDRRTLVTPHKPDVSPWVRTMWRYQRSYSYRK